MNQEVQKISAEEVRTAMNRMKTGKMAVGPSWKMKECLMNEKVCLYQFSRIKGICGVAVTTEALN